MVDHPDFEVEAYSPDSEDAVKGSVHGWTEIVLEVSEPLFKSQTARHPFRMELTRAGAEAIIDSLHSVLHPWAGKSIAQTTFDKLVEITKRLLEDGGEPEDIGRAQGMAWSIALMRNPYDTEAAYEQVRQEAVEQAEG